MKVSEEERSAFLKKSAQKTFAPPALERPQYGRSSAVVNKSFLLLFFKKEVLSSSFLWSL